MKTIGLIGGMSWESTIPYYRQINETIKQRLGGLHSAKIVLYSVDFQEIEALQHTGQWEQAGLLLADVAKRLEAAGAEGVVLCTNTMHKVATAIESATRIPLLHIADPTAEAIQHAGISTVGLLGTRFTMEQDFYRARLEDKYGLTVLTPNAEDRDTVHRIIYDELCLGHINDGSRNAYSEVINRLVENGAEAVILGCTEISLLIEPQHVDIPLFDTTRLHAEHAAEWMLR
ncbi:aspartate/glutamate racemase family protein [Paenalcaligenes sp. Me131]|uniref:aspartate/glutamate racemase family protein n=1 Tax=Paenalcaligenes sp. Me131 TaxID=3392636 RepID=UPI003D28D472